MTNRLAKWKGVVSTALTTVLLSMSTTLVQAQYLPSVKLLEADAISPSSAWSYYSANGGSTSGTAPDRDGLIEDLARALKNDPDLIYEHVHNSIEFTPQFGLKKGGLGAILSGYGTAFDQAHLMVELLRESGYSASYRYGTRTVTGTEFQNWFDITQARAACEALAHGGIPATVNGSTNCASLSGTVGNVTLAHVWVRVNIGGSNYEFDPAYKQHDRIAGIDLGPILQYNEANLLNNATCSGTNCSELSNINVTGFNSELESYADNLLAYLKNENPDMRLKDLIGGKTIIPYAHDPASPLRQSSIPNTSVQSTWGNHVPNAFRTELNVAFLDVNESVYADEIAGERFWIEWQPIDKINTQIKYVLRSDAQQFAESNWVDLSATHPMISGDFSLELSINHPYANDNGAYADAAVDKQVAAGYSITLVFGLGDEGDGAVGYWSDLASFGPEKYILPQHFDNEQILSVFYGSSFGSDELNGDAVTVASWLTRFRELLMVHERLAQNQVIAGSNHSIGVVYTAATTVIQHNGPAIYDVRPFGAVHLDIDAGVYLVSAASSGADQQAAFRAVVSGLSALEASILTETREFAKPVSVGSVFAQAAENNFGVRRYTTLAAFNADRAALLALPNGYVDAQLDIVADYLSAGQEVILPLASTMPGRANSRFLSWQFEGGSQVHTVSDYGAFLAEDTSGAQLSPIITASLAQNNHVRALKGGAADVAVTQDELYRLELNYLGSRGGLSATPSLQTGSVSLSPAPDMVVGEGMSQLAFQRHYSSDRGNNGGGIGIGWTHNYLNSVTQGTNLSVAMGKNRAIEAVRALVAMYASRQLSLTSRTDNQVFTLLSDFWWNDQATHNVATLESQFNTLQFVKLSDETYLAPAGSVAELRSTGQPPMLGTPHDRWNGTFVDPVINEMNAYNYVNTTFEYETANGDITYFGINNGYTLAQIANLQVPINKIGRTRRMAHREVSANGVELTYLYGGLGPSVPAPANSPFLYEPAGVRNNLGQELFFEHVYPSDSITVTVGGGDSQSLTTYPVLESVIDNSGRKVEFGYYWSVNGTSNSNGSLTIINMSDTLTLTRVIDIAGGETAYGYYAEGVEPAVPIDYTFPLDISNWPAFFASVSEMKGVAHRLSEVSLPSQATSIPAGQRFADIEGTTAGIGGGTALALALNEQPYLSMAYDSAARLKSMTNGLGNSTDFYISGRRGEAVSPLGDSISVYFDVYGNASRSINALGQVSTADYDDNGRLIRITRAEGNGVEYEYDNNDTTYPIYNNITEARVTSKLGSDPDIVSTYAYNDTNWPTAVTRMTDPRGTISDVIYNATTGVPTRYTMGVGTSSAMRTDYTYESFGRLKDTIVDPTGLNEVVRNVYWPVNAGSSAAHTNGELKDTIVDPGGLNITSSFTYNSRGDVLTVTDPRGFASSTAYDVFRRPISSVLPDPDGAGPELALATINHYDEDGLLLRAEQRSGTTTGILLAVTETDYNALGQPWKTYNEECFTTAGARNTGLAGCGIVTTTYDLAARPDIVTDPEGRQSRTVYDALSRPTRIIRALGTPLQQDYQTYTYTVNGQHATVEDANGNLTSYEYDGFDRLSRTRFPHKSSIGQSSTADYEDYRYDIAGNLIGKRTRQGDWILNAYDPLNRDVRKLTQTGGSFSAISTSCGSSLSNICYSYDDASRQTQIRYGNNSYSITHNYDDAGRLTSTTDDGRTIGYQYDAAGNRTRIDYPGSDNFYITYQYDNQSRLEYIREKGSLALATYAYDARSRRDNVLLGNGRVIDYEYDPDSAVAQIEHENLLGSGNHATWDFGYNKANQVNMKSLPDQFEWQAPDQKTDNYSINGLNQYSAINGQAISYDDNGSLTSDGVWIYDYDVENRLISAIGPGINATYSYDPLGRRASKSGSGVAAEVYLNDGVEEIADYDGSGNLLRRYVNGLGVDERLAMYTGTGTSNKEYYHTDHQGSAIAMSNQSGALLDTYTYTAYGESGIEGTTGNPFRYTGRRLDPETGLYYYRARYYSPALGRFLQTDPIGYGDNMNMYAYVGNDPVNYFDPRGMQKTVLDRHRDQMRRGGKHQARDAGEEALEFLGMEEHNACKNARCVGQANAFTMTSCVMTRCCHTNGLCEEDPEPDVDDGLPDIAPEEPDLLDDLTYDEFKEVMDERARQAEAQRERMPSDDEDEDEDEGEGEGEDEGGLIDFLRFWD